MESFGKALVLEPFLSSVVLGGGSRRRGRVTPEQKAQLLPGVADGSTLLAFGYAEPGSRWSLTDIGPTARPDGDGWTVSGQKIAVARRRQRRPPDRHRPHARRRGRALPRRRDRLGGTARSAPAAGRRCAGPTCSCDAAPATALGAPAEALAAVESVLDVATAALCAEAVGAMERMLWLTVDYLKARVQFGQPIAVFQTLQHRAADMYVSLEQARSMALVARLALDDDDVDDRRRMVRAAKIRIDTAARHISQEAIQLHGGIGMTMEYPVGHYAKRVAVIAKTFADTDTLIDQVGAGGGLVAAG